MDPDPGPSQQNADVLADQVKAVHRNYPTGVTVITTSIDDQPYGLAVNAFSSVSLDPPTVLFCVNQHSKTHAHLMDADVVGINILGFDQGDVAAVFSSSGGDKFASLSWHTGLHGAPMIDGAAARLQARIEDRHSVGTHTVFYCTVVHAEAAEHEPLVYLRGSFIDGKQVNELAQRP